MADLRDFNPAIKYGAKLQNSSLDSGKILVGNSSNLAQEITLSGDATIDAGGTFTFGQGRPFVATRAIARTDFGTSTGSSVQVLADLVVSQNRKVYPMGMMGYVANTNWDTGASGANPTGRIDVTDNSGGTFFSFGTANLTSNTVIGSIYGGIGFQGMSASGTVAFGTAYLTGVGGAASKGLVATPSTGTFSAGGTLYLTVWGFIK